MILTDAAAITRRSAEEFLKATMAAVEEKGSFAVALAGGSTPRALYALLADDPKLRTQIPWDKIYFFFGDERHVPPDHADSNFRMANESLFSKLQLRSGQVSRIHGEYPDS